MECKGRLRAAVQICDHRIHIDDLLLCFYLLVRTLFPVLEPVFRELLPSAWVTERGRGCNFGLAPL